MEFLSLMVEETFQAKGLIFLIIFGFFVNLKCVQSTHMPRIDVGQFGKVCTVL